MARVFKLKGFAKDALAAKIADRELCEKARQAKNGLVYAELGGGVVKVKLNRTLHRGMLLIKGRRHTFFALLFAKKDMENVSDAVLEVLKIQAEEHANLTDIQIQAALAKGTLIEVECSSHEGPNERG